ncbi:S-layer homology domain-containing protein [Paenibacillus sp. LHD-38]|uniref:rhamnogalacturonan lyase family protein n=1 Tax=Paenibacillus sp. LHD-38 TaxID=3072143 RepID=UPI00280D22AA|nr:S-layer homology domain-containing protein [Paenibacillus sp. LHD-38]MDQ8734729.1 S-layer homology domain-containing protein [Paenibacillus sp. LHD-38]
MQKSSIRNGKLLLSKLLSCMLVMSLLMPLHLASVHAADKALVSDDFSSYKNGEFTIGAGNNWTKEGTAPTVNFSKNTVTGSTYAEITHNGTGSSYFGQRFAAQNGGTIIEFDVNLPTNKGGTLWVMDGKVNATNAAALRYQLDAGVIKRHNAAAENQINYDPTHWYRFKMVFNTPQKKYTVSITDLTTETTVVWPDAFYSPRERISSFGFFVNAGGGTFNLTNVKVTALDLALSSLGIQAGDSAAKLVPPFDPKVDNYTLEVPYWVSELAVHPAASNPGGVSLKVGEANVESGGAKSIALTESSTSFGVSVTSSAYSDIYKTYTVTVNKLDKDPNVNYPVAEGRDSKVLLGWEEPSDPAYQEARIYKKNDDESLVLVDTVAKGKYISTINGLTNGTPYSFVIKGAFAYEGEEVTESAGVTVSAEPSKQAARQMENLDRGLVAVKQADHVYVGWRMLGTDPSAIAFNLYRDGAKVNASPITNSTNFEDAGGKSDSIYFVRAVIDGTEQRQSESAEVWDTNALDVPIQKPADGVTPSGEAYSYRANDASIADLDGDGQYEIVLKWDPSNAKDNSQSGYTGNTYVDAYELDGTQLWRIDLGKNIRSGAHYLDVMVYDLDGDGKAEVTFRTADGTIDGKGQVIGDAEADYRNASGYILTGPEYHTVFEGATGKALATEAYEPERGNVADWGDAYGNRVDRFLAAIAYLDGERPSIIMQRGYYTRMVLVAYNWRDGKLTKLWTFDSKTAGNESYAGQGNHQLSVADVDADGRDEIITGATAIDDNGTGLWNSRLGHGDAMHLGDLDPTRLGLELFAVQEDTSVKYSADVKDARTGRVLWGQLQTGIDTGRGLSADIDPRYEGAEAWAIDGAWNSPTGGLFTAQGEKIANQIPSSNFAIWWDGDLSRELLDHVWQGDTLRVGIPKIDKWDYEANQLVNLETFTGTHSNNDTKGNPALQVDMLGDWREEVIVRTEDSSALRIYTTSDVTEHRIPTLMHDPVYRVGIAWQNTGYNQPPHTSFFLGTGMETPAQPNIRTNEIKATGLSISLSSTEAAVGQQIQLNPVFTPAAATNQSVSWSVYNEDGSATKLASINASGLLTAAAVGKVKVEAAAKDGSAVVGSALLTIKAAITEVPSGGTAPQPAVTVGSGSVKQTVAVDAFGKAAVEFKAADVAKAAETAAGKSLVLEVATDKAAAAVQAVLPAQALKTSVDKTIQTVEVRLGLATISIDKALITSSVTNEASKVELSVRKIDAAALPEEVREKVGARPVLDFNLTVDGKKVSAFDGSVKVELDYKLAEGENPNAIVIYYVDEQNKLHLVKNGAYQPSTGKVVFKPSHFSQYAVSYVKTSFTDIARVSWAKDSIESLAARSIVNGVGNQTFKPDLKVTRAEFLKMLMFAFDLADEGTKSELSDLQEGSWYYSSIASAQKLGIVQGKADGSFGVNDEITRQDMAVMAYRASQHLKLGLGGQASSAAFADQAAIVGYAVEAAEAMQAAGIIQGIGGGVFAPKEQATRAQAAVIIHMLIQLSNV